MLKLFNSLSSSKENFEPFSKDPVKIFICGPTVYDYTHLGHARIFLTFDLLCRQLEDQGFLTDVLVNVTDMNKNVFYKAKETFVTYKEVAKFYTSEFLHDLNTLGIKSVNRIAYVSDYVQNIEEEITKLVQREVAYTAHGNVYLDISKLKNYGEVSKQTREQLNLHRLDIGPGKRNQEDIMLWNCTEDFGFSWESKFGKGIPWWHIQDTTVAIENFGDKYDIHGGARELLYPHHEAHLAQFRLLSDSDNPVKIWMHIGLVLTEGEKMSKSIGNVVWVKDLIRRYGKSLIRLYVFSKHYREEINFSEKDINSKKPLLEILQLTRSSVSDATDEVIINLIQDFIRALNDDLNSPAALERLYEICIEVKKGKNVSQSDFNHVCKLIGIEV